MSFNHCDIGRDIADINSQMLYYEEQSYHLTTDNK